MNARIAASLAIALIAAYSTAQADEYVSGYVKKDGTYVPGHYRSSPNSTTLDNWSVRPNVNPYTGASGYKSPTPPTYRYDSPKVTTTPSPYTYRTPKPYTYRAPSLDD